MSSGSILFIGLLGGAGALFMTNPGDAEVQDLVRDNVVSAIVSSESGALARFGCTMGDLSSTECSEAIRTIFGIRTSIEDYAVFSRVSVKIGNDSLECITALHNIHCPKFLNEE